MKGELNNDGQQFHKYQAIEHNNDHNIWRWKFQVLAWDRHKNVAGLHQFERYLIQVIQEMRRAH
jgi:hypothetical protein